MTFLEDEQGISRFWAWSVTTGATPPPSYSLASAYSATDRSVVYTCFVSLLYLPQVWFVVVFCFVLPSHKFCFGEILSMSGYATPTRQTINISHDSFKKKEKKKFESWLWRYLNLNETGLKSSIVIFDWFDISAGTQLCLDMHQTHGGFQPLITSA